MSTFSLPYGTGYLSFQVPEKYKVDLIAPKEALAVPDAVQAITQAIEAPIGLNKLPKYNHARTVAIAINDKTRPVPHNLLLPPLLQSLEDAGIAPQNITLLIATGTHVPMPPEE